MSKQDIRHGISKAIPVVLGYVPLGFAFGVLARGAGLSILQVAAMSILVFAGSGQFIAVAMLQAGAGIGSIVMTTFVVNLRLLLFSASLAPYLKKFSGPKLALLSYELTDEDYAVSMGEFADAKSEPDFMWGLFPSCHLGWVISTVLGAAVGNLIPNPGAFGLDYALPAMFICLLIFQLRDKLAYLTAVLAAVLSIGIFLVLPGRWNIIIATVIAASVGTGVEKWLKSI